ncbi:hypothetical protein SAMN06297280_1826 [Arsukibacterium tuosuense]|uniref:Uncharacterized protein n=1 Tax=Arsukibacterium tuosuense TaxID=1323745 RepID=A0A285IU57_9GAMM|nr:hypothetical protein [Arsukibacterium tuosuense]SNY51363.1 hypothetical protein SAMN06297280_1826 [Arsukibacterium tuosuense]
MRIALMLIFLIFMPSVAFTAEHQHSYIGNHGMVLFAADDILLASHLPLYQPPHNYQLIYQLTLPAKAQQAVLDYLGTEKQLTLLPEQFDLQKLINGENFTARAAVYYDHFERNGRVWFEDIPVRFARQLYKRPINQPGSATEARYDVVKINQSYFLIHQIAAKPSYDQILRTEQAPPQPLVLKAPADITAIQQLNAMGIQATEVYLDTADFQ